MRRRTFFILTPLFMLILSFGAWILGVKAQTPATISVIGSLNQILGTPSPYAGVKIQLANCASPISVTGYNVIVQTEVQLQANASGVINSTIWPNDVITCNGTTGASIYMVTYIVGGVPQGATSCYQVVEAQEVWNLQTQQPISCGSSPPNPQDASYRNLTLTGFLQGVNGAMTGTWQANVFTDIGLESAVGDCVVVQTGGILGAQTCGGGSGGGITLLTGDGTTPAGGGSQPFTLATVNGTTGSCGDATHVCAITTIGKGLTIHQAATAITFPTQIIFPNPGIVFGITNTTARTAMASDLTALLGGTPLLTTNNLSDVSGTNGLTNLFNSASLDSVPLLGTGGTGLPFPVQIGQGLNYSSTAGSQGIASVTSSLSSAYFGTSGNYALTFSGGGGTGAAGYVTITCPLRSPCSAGIVTITAAGSGYTSAPTVTQSTLSSAGYTFVATLTTGGLLSAGTMGTATLASGTVTVTTAAACTVSGSCVYQLTHCGPNSSTAIGALSTGSIASGTSFVINALTSTNTVATGDLSNVCWRIN